jgi:ATP-binding protein involved in chromosome partitioning
MPISKDDIKRELTNVHIPGFKADLVSGGCVEWIAVCDDTASLKLHVPDADPAAMNTIANDAAQALAKAFGPLKLTIEFVDHAGTIIRQFRAGAAPEAPQPSGHQPIRGLAGAPSSQPANAQDGASGLPGVKHVIAVGAGKGGVGKSTVAVNLAVGLARKGHAVGLMDGDIYGPSLPTMFGLDALETNVHSGMLQPFFVHGVKSMTLGKLVDPDKPLIWRGPMAHGAFKQLAEQTQWGELDYLVVDLPPGTGDVPLTMAQTLQLTGAVVVCTPQKVAQDDAVRAVKMFQELGIEVLGVVENMSFFIGDDGKEYDIFGRGGAEQMAQRLGLPFLGAIPITMKLRENCDTGDPTANFEPADTALARSLLEFLDMFEKQSALASMRQGQTRPTLSIS